MACGERAPHDRRRRAEPLVAGLTSFAFDARSGRYALATNFLEPGDVVKGYFEALFALLTASTTTRGRVESTSRAAKSARARPRRTL